LADRTTQLPLQVWALQAASQAAVPNPVPSARQAERRPASQLENDPGRQLLQASRSLLHPFAQFIWLVKPLPAVLHTSSRVPSELQRWVLPGSQLVHMPAPVQLYWQVVPLPQLPLSSQVRGVRPEHDFAPGRQSPVQAAPEQMLSQVRSFCQVPALQNRTVPPTRPLQSRVPGTHWPVHWPRPVQTYWQG
jgi:hypothetical protein